MPYIVVDIEADGPIPGDYSMVCFGAIVVEPSLGRTFYGRLKPVSDKWIIEALRVSGFTREETLAFDAPKTVMQRFAEWIGKIGQPMSRTTTASTGSSSTGISTTSSAKTRSDIARRISARFTRAS